MVTGYKSGRPLLKVTEVNRYVVNLFFGVFVNSYKRLSKVSEKVSKGYKG